MGGGRYVTTQTSIYTDPDLRHWKPLSIYFYRYLYENEHVHGVSGVGRIAEDVIRNETRLTRKQIERAKQDIGERVRWFPDGSYWVVARAKHTCYTGGGKLHPKFAASARNYIEMCGNAVAMAFARQYPQIITDALPTEWQSDAKPTLPTEAVAVAVSEAEAAVAVNTQCNTNTRPARSAPDWEDSDYKTIVNAVHKDCRAELSNAKRKTGFQKYPPSWVLAALWQVNDRKKQGPVEIIKRAFGLLKRGSPKDSLLDRAKKELAKGRRKSPSGIGDLLKGAKP